MMAKTESLAALPAWPDFVVDYITDGPLVDRFADQTRDHEEQIVMVARAVTRHDKYGRQAVLQPIPRRTAKFLVSPNNLEIMRSALSGVLGAYLTALDARGER
jgi:Trm5-related predicted tRNA methylase